LVKALVSDGELADSTLWNVTVIPGVGVDDNPELVNITKLSQNYPNPFNPSTKIEFSIEQNQQNEQIELEIYNVKGQKIKTLECNNHIIAEATESLHHVTWDGTDENNQPVSSGIYLYHLNVNGKTVASRKMILLK
jgi:flagellar hook assembly protein FlgD